MSKGRIHKLVSRLEAQHTPFAVSRLIMMSGIPVRRFGPDSDDPPEALSKLQVALRGMLQPGDLKSLLAILKD